MCHLKNIFHYINIELKGGVFFVVVTKPSPLPLPSLPIFPLAVLDFEIDRKMLGVARRKLGFGLFSATISKGLLEKYGPDRVLDTPITEAAIRDPDPVVFLENELLYVINLRSIRPLDRATINASVRKTNRLVTVEEVSEIMVLNCFLQVDDIVRATKRACYRSVPMAAAA
ncbi:hypothetical protein BHE74_00011595 [Ensete ventricosum]|nr:hypothetical protein BHE74_00011595 [Ensete ventricosum]